MDGLSFLGWLGSKSIKISCFGDNSLSLIKYYSQIFTISTAMGL